MRSKTSPFPGKSLREKALRPLMVRLAWSAVTGVVMKIWIVRSTAILNNLIRRRSCERLSSRFVINRSLIARGEPRFPDREQEEATVSSLKKSASPQENLRFQFTLAAACDRKVSNRRDEGVLSAVSGPWSP